MAVEATVVQINTKPKTATERGLPKHPIEEAFVSKKGVGDDFNIYRQESKGGTPDRAVLIYTIDKIEELNREGWPIKPGDIGENFTVAGLRYDDLDIGDRISIGDIVVEISERCNPCTNLQVLSYVGKTKVNQFIKTMKGRRGWYARVLVEGHVRKGDPVKLSL